MANVQVYLSIFSQTVMVIIKKKKILVKKIVSITTIIISDQLLPQ